MFYSTVKIILISDSVKRLPFQGVHSLEAYDLQKASIIMDDSNSVRKRTTNTDNSRGSLSIIGEGSELNNKNMRGRGRPKLVESERRKKLNLIYLTDEELLMLRQQHAGPAEHFGTFLRRKLLVNKTFVVPREIDPEVRNEIRNLLKLTGNINLIALKTKGDIEVSEEFRKTSTLIRSIAATAKKSVDHSVELMEVAPSLVERLNGLLQAVEYVEDGFGDFGLLRTGILEIIQSLEPIIRKFER